MSTTETTTLNPETLTGEYTFDVAHTTFGFAARHAMVAKVRGKFGQFDGAAHLDFTDPSKSSVKVEIKAASIDTGNPDRDTHLRSNDFFAMDEYPTITFESTAIEPVDEQTFHVTGDLTIRGVTKQVEFDSELHRRRRRPVGQHPGRVRRLADREPQGLRRQLEHGARGRRRRREREGHARVRRCGDQKQLAGDSSRGWSARPGFAVRQDREAGRAFQPITEFGMRA